MQAIRMDFGAGAAAIRIAFNGAEAVDPVRPPVSNPVPHHAFAP